MREIKFRFWDKDLKKMLYRKPTYNDFSHPNIIPMQFIGLRDKNRVEIYEGCLLSDPFPVDEEDLSKGYHENFLPVIWCSETLQWCVDASFAKDGSFLTSLVEYFGEFLEVKGNIYENPEMLEAVISADA